MGPFDTVPEFVLLKDSGNIEALKEGERGPLWLPCCTGLTEVLTSYTGGGLDTELGAYALLLLSDIDYLTIKQNEHEKEVNNHVSQKSITLNYVQLQIIQVYK